MAVKNDGLCMTYTINRLSETAKTFRRLGEAYECASGDEAQSPSFKRQLFLVADILEDCTLMQLQADKPSKGIARDMASRALVAGIVIKDVNILKDKTGRSEVVILARTLGKGCVAERKIRKIVCDVMGVGYYSDHNNRLVINDNCQQYVFHQENRFRFLYDRCKQISLRIGKFKRVFRIFTKSGHIAKGIGFELKIDVVHIVIIHILYCSHGIFRIRITVPFQLDAGYRNGGCGQCKIICRFTFRSGR